MIITIIILLLTGLFSRHGAARAYLAADGVAVFEPKGFEPAQHLPSPIFAKALEDNGPVPEGWALNPVFSRLLGKNAVTIETGDADLYGGGEVYGDLRRNGEKQFLWSTDNATGMLKNGKRMYQSHPWLLGVRKDGSAFGIIADNTWKSTMSMKGRVRFVSEGPAFRVVIIEKDDPAQVMQALSDLSGRMELPPLWTLGYHQCRYSYFPQEQAAEVADEFRSRKIPCDVIWMDIHYMDAFKVFTFDPEGYRDPEGHNSYLHDNGFRTVYMIDPGIKVEKGYFVDEQGLEGDYFLKDKKGAPYVSRVWPGDCHFPDYTRPDVRRWWAGLYRDFMAKGIDGVWNDMNEPTNFEGFGSTLPEDIQHMGGPLEGDDCASYGRNTDETCTAALPEGPHLRYHNIYGYLMVKASREGILAVNPDKRPFLLSRSNFLGGQRYAATWTGDNFSDWYAMKVSVPMTINMGLTLQTFNGPDIGGFLRDCTPELLRHWTASGVYFPFVRNHSSLGTVNQEPYVFDKQTEDICRTAIVRRYRLLPYFYTVFEEASRTGVPVMRPVFWADFKDLSLRAEQQAYLVGGDILVIPRWSESPALPKGGWQMFTLENDGNSCESDDGYQSILALRPGAIVPVIDVIQSTVDYSTDSLTLLVNPDSAGKACGTLYEDAGDGFAYRDGEFIRSAFEATTENGEIILTERRLEGMMERAPRALRIGLVCDRTITFSPWSTDGTARIQAGHQTTGNLDLSDISFVKLKDGSISKKMTKRELILTNIVK